MILKIFVQEQEEQVSLLCILPMLFLMPFKPWLDWLVVAENTLEILWKWLATVGNGWKYFGNGWKWLAVVRQ